MPTNQCLPFSMSGWLSESEKKSNFIVLSRNKILYKKLRRYINVSIKIDCLMSFDACITNNSPQVSKVFNMYLQKRFIIDAWIVMQNITGVSFSNLRGIILRIWFCCTDVKLNLWCIGMNETDRHSYTVLW